MAVSIVHKTHYTLFPKEELTIKVDVYDPMAGALEWITGSTFDNLTKAVEELRTTAPQFIVYAKVTHCVPKGKIKIGKFTQTLTGQGPGVARGVQDLANQLLGSSKKGNL